MRRSTRLVVPFAAIAMLAGALTSPAGAAGPAGRDADRSPSARNTALARFGTDFEGRLPSGVDPGAPSLEPAAPLPRTPSETLGFDAIPKTLDTVPADPTGAVSDSYFLTAVNSHVQLFDLTGAAVAGFDPPIRLRTLGGVPSGWDDFDPKVVYDPYDDMFVLVFLAMDDLVDPSRSKIVIAAIPDATADDTGTWCVTGLKGDQADDGKRSWADYPGLGFTSARVTVATNQFAFDTFAYHHVQILSISKTTLYDGACPSLGFKVFSGDDARNPDGSKAFTIQPAVTNGGASPTTQFMLSFQDNGFSGTKLILWRLKPGSGGLTLKRTALQVGEAIVAPSGTQCGGTAGNSNTWWDTGDLRLINAFYDADLDKVYAAHAVFKDIAPSGYNEAAIRWYEVSPGSPLSSSTVEKGIVGISKLDLAWPAVATDNAGNLFIAMAGAGFKDDICLSAYAAEVDTATDAFSTTQLTAGEARFEWGSGSERWGDYSAISRDPADGSLMAMVNAYAKSDGAGATPDWQQVVDVVTSI